MSPGVVPKSAIANSRRLRREMSEGEKHLWSQLRKLRNSHSVHVRRQAPIGPYVTDFIIHAARLVVEVDGPMHMDEGRIDRDIARDKWLAEAGYKVMRFKTEEIMTAWSDCVERILKQVEAAN